MIHDFKDHPFKVLDDDKMSELVESIRINGVLSPVLVRQDGEDSYEMISGHRRMHAAKIVGLTMIPAIVRDLTDDEAIVYMVDSNIQREELLPSEKAFAFKMKMDALKRQGLRRDLTSDHNGPKLSAWSIGEDNGISGTQVKRYIRLTELIPELLDMVDAKRITEAVMELYGRITDEKLLVRRITLTANHVTEEGLAKREIQYEQLDLFTDYAALEKQQQEERAAREKERRMQQAMLDIRGKYGKNAILKGINLKEGATARERNGQIGGHRA